MRPALPLRHAAHASAIRAALTAPDTLQPKPFDPRGTMGDVPPQQRLAHGGATPRGMSLRRWFPSALVVVVALAMLSVFARTGRVLGAGRCERASIFIDKSDGVLELRCGAVRRGRFEVTFGAQPRGPKLREGDERTPEGRYTVTSRVRSPRFHLFLGVSYPNDEDRRRARSLGITNPGGGIGIHGVRRSHSALARAWIRLSHDTRLGQLWGPTDGCIGLTNEDIEQVFDAVQVGTPVEIVP